MRISPTEAATWVQRALQQIDLDRAVLFHDLDRVRSRLDELSTAFAPGTLHAIAIKANPLVEVLRAVVDSGAGLEAASFEEVALARAAGCPADRLVYDSPAKTTAELTAALQLGLWLNIDCAAELARLEALGAPGAARIGIRVNPGVGTGRIAATSTVGKGGRFGVPLERVGELVQRYPWVSGLHVHTGSQGVGLELIEAAVRATADEARGLGLEWIDVGGGIPVRYTDSDPEPPCYAEWGERIGAACTGLKMLTEPGRSIHAAAGFAVARVEAVKIIDGQPGLVVHAGADLFLRRVYAPQHWDHRFSLLDSEGRLRTAAPVPSTIVGPLCFSGDVLARSRPLPPAQPGDFLVIHDAGAYTLSMWSRHCSRGIPPAWGISKGELVALHKGESPEDVVRFWSGR